MRIIPITDTFSQKIAVNLDGQSCKINIYQKSTGLYCDLYVNDVLILGGVICKNLIKIVRSSYLKFSGDLFFQDMQGKTDPTSPGLGTRYLFCYVSQSELN